MQTLFNFIVFSNTQNFVLFSELGVVWSYPKLVGKKNMGSPRLFRRYYG